MTGRSWDAAVYDRVSSPQVEMAGPVLDRLPLAGDETVLDAGCGSGRVTELILERLPHGRVVAVDADAAMLDEARRRLAGRPVELLQADLTALELPEPVDAIFSTSVFHWIPDHDALFASLGAALCPGGRLVAQCGGEGNVRQTHGLAREVGASEPYAPHFAGWRPPQYFAGVDVTRERLERCGFTDIEVWLEPWPVRPDEPHAFLRTVCLGPWMDRLPEDLRDRFVADFVERSGEPLELDYVRLNITAVRT